MAMTSIECPASMSIILSLGRPLNRSLIFVLFRKNSNELSTRLLVFCFTEWFNCGRLCFRRAANEMCEWTRRYSESEGKKQILEPREKKGETNHCMCSNLMSWMTAPSDPYRFAFRLLFKSFFAVFEIRRWKKAPTKKKLCLRIEIDLSLVRVGNSAKLTVFVSVLSPFHSLHVAEYKN